MNIAIVIPAYNEKDNILKLVTEISKRINECEIIIVDDSKEDKISESIRGFKNIKYVFRGKKLGRGSAVLEGLNYLINNSQTEIFIEMDADYSHDPLELKKNLILLKENNMIY